MFPFDLDPVVEKDLRSSGECEPKIPDMAKPVPIPVDDDVVCCSPPTHVQLASIELRMEQIRFLGSGFTQVFQHITVVLYPYFSFGHFPRSST